MQEQTSPWCCSQFREQVMPSEKQGVSIKIVEAPGYGHGLAFFLEYRAVRQDAHVEIKAAADVKIVLQHSQGIRYCPWCGENLQSYYAQIDDLPVVPYTPDIEDK